MTDTDICNMALSNLGKGTIISMDDKEENARACKLYYDQTRETVLRAYPWSFAHRIEKLALLDKEIPGYDFCYVYPKNCLKINNIRNKQINVQEHVPYVVVNIDTATKAIACNLQNAYADYTVNEKDVQVMDTLFISAFTRLLAANMAMRLTGNPQAYQMQYQLFQAIIHDAQLNDAREGQRDAVYHSNYAQTRRVR